LTQGLIGLADKLPGSRMLEGRFMGVQQSIGVPKGRDAGLQYLRSVVEEAKASGLVARAIERPAPAASRSHRESPLDRSSGLASPRYSSRVSSTVAKNAECFAGICNSLYRPAETQRATARFS